MKRVRTNRKRPDVLVVFELDQANGAVLAPEAGLGGVERQRYGLDDGLVEPVGGEHVEAVGGVERRVVRRGVEVADGGREVGAASTAAPVARESDYRRDDVAGDEAGVGDD